MSGKRVQRRTVGSHPALTNSNALLQFSRSSTRLVRIEMRLFPFLDTVRMPKFKHSIDSLSGWCLNGTPTYKRLAMHSVRSIQLIYECKQLQIISTFSTC